ncbi:MAG: hypothetical protein HUU38_29875 [Anaerolineales bacterium]|nr:hypothetical protein [Anaerolineales bacterium]
MKKQFQLFKRATLLSLLLGVLVVGVAFATTITVDGNPVDWPGHSSCTAGNSGCSFVTNDPNEVAPDDVPDDNDIAEVWATNDTSNLFFRFDTYAATSFSSGEFVRICLDIPGQGPGVGSIGGCGGLLTDRLILIVSGIVRVADCNLINCNDNFTVFINGTPGTVAVSGVVTEISATTSSLGITSADDGSIIDTVLYFDNNGLPADDNIPDSGSVGVEIGTGSPTAITLESLSARNINNMVAIGVAGVLVLGGAIILLRRRKTITE